MPRISTTVAGSAQVPANGYYPKLLRGASGSIWLVSGPTSGKRNRATGTIIHLSNRPQKSHHKVGYTTGILNESKMTVCNDPVTLQFA